MGGADDAPDAETAGECPLLEGDGRPTDAIDAGVDLVEHSRCDAMRHHSASEAESVEFGAGHQAVVAGGVLVHAAIAVHGGKVPTG